MIKNLTITGGTHGNELTGVYLVKQWQKDPSAIQRETFKTNVVLMNEEAIKRCTRYIDRDLNRCFDTKTLTKSPQNHEEKIAQNLNATLGPKGSDRPNSDFIVDLHSTTSNMGLSIVVSNESDLTWLAISYLKQKVPRVRVYKWMGDEEDAFVDSIAKHGFAIEVGAIPQGVLRSDLFFDTQKLVYHLLDFIDHYNKGFSMALESVEYFEHEILVDYPRDSQGNIVAMVHEDRQDRDFDLISKGNPIFRKFDGEEIFYEGESLHTLFINEAAYYEKGFAMTLARKALRVL